MPSETIDAFTEFDDSKLALPVRLVDAAGLPSGVITSVGTFHNADNQALPASGGAILTAGVAQLLNAVLGADRQRETGLDGITAQGVSTGTAQLAQAVSTTTTGAIS